MQRLYYQDLFKSLTEHRPHEVVSHFKKKMDEKALQETNSRALSLLQIAAREGYVDAVLMLIYAGATVDQTQEIKHEDQFVMNQAESSAFYLAMQRGHLQVAEMLLVCGASKEHAIQCARRDQNHKLAEAISNLKVRETTLRYMLFWATKNYSKHYGNHLLNFLKPDPKELKVCADVRIAENHTLEESEYVIFQKLSQGLELKEPLDNDTADSIADYAIKHKQYDALKKLLNHCNVPRLLARALRDRNKDLASFILVNYHFDRYRVMSDLFRKKLFHYWLYYCDSPQGCLHEIMSRATLKDCQITNEQHENIAYLKKHNIDVTNTLMYCIADRYSNPEFVNLMTTRDIAMSDRIRLQMPSAAENRLKFYRKTAVFVQRRFQNFRLELVLPKSTSQDKDGSYRLPDDVWRYVASFFDVRTRANTHAVSSHFNATLKKIESQQKKKALEKFQASLVHAINLQQEKIDKESSFFRFLRRQCGFISACTGLNIALFGLAALPFSVMIFMNKTIDDLERHMENLFLEDYHYQNCYALIYKNFYGDRFCDHRFIKTMTAAVAQCVEWCDQYDSEISHRNWMMGVYIIFGMISLGSIFGSLGLLTELRPSRRKEYAETDPDFLNEEIIAFINEQAPKLKLEGIGEVDTPVAFIRAAENLLEHVTQCLSELDPQSPAEEESDVAVTITDKQQDVEVENAVEIDEDDRLAPLRVPLLSGGESNGEVAVEMAGLSRALR